MEALRRLFELLTGFDGRINRAKWWLALLIVGAANVLGGLILNPDFFLSAELPSASWPDTLWQIALLYPGTAITVKRFNDTEPPALARLSLCAIRGFHVLRSAFGRRSGLNQS